MFSGSSCRELLCFPAPFVWQGTESDFKAIKRGERRKIRCFIKIYIKLTCRSSASDLINFSLPSHHHFWLSSGTFFRSFPSFGPFRHPYCLRKVTNGLIICYVILDVMKMEKWKIARDHRMSEFLPRKSTKMLTRRLRQNTWSSLGGVENCHQIWRFMEINDQMAREFCSSPRYMLCKLNEKTKTSSVPHCFAFASRFKFVCSKSFKANKEWNGTVAHREKGKSVVGIEEIRNEIYSSCGVDGVREEIKYFRSKEEAKQRKKKLLCEAQSFRRIFMSALCTERSPKWNGEKKRKKFSARFSPLLLFRRRWKEKVGGRVRGGGT